MLDFSFNLISKYKELNYLKEMMISIVGMSLMLFFNMFLYLEFGLKTVVISLTVFILISLVQLRRLIR